MDLEYANYPMAAMFNPFSAGTVFIRHNMTSVDGDRLYTSEYDTKKN